MKIENATIIMALSQAIKLKKYKWKISAEKPEDDDYRVIEIPNIIYTI